MQCIVSLKVGVESLYYVVMRREAQYRGIIPFICLPGVKFEMNEGGKDLGVPWRW